MARIALVGTVIVSLLSFGAWAKTAQRSIASVGKCFGVFSTKEHPSNNRYNIKSSTTLQSCIERSQKDVDVEFYDDSDTNLLESIKANSIPYVFVYEGFEYHIHRGKIVGVTK